jgi:hypothetical protein
MIADNNRVNYRGGRVLLGMVEVTEKTKSGIQRKIKRLSNIWRSGMWNAWKPVTSR